MNLNIIEQKNKKLIIDNLTHVGVSSEDQLTKVINKGLLNRTNNLPSIKEHNSKSHFIIMITLFHFLKIENYMKIGKLYIVDLEGSERISKVKLQNETLEEQKLINKSLIALSRIVQNLSNEENINFVPYRDSKLTRIISDCFGGNAYTTLILNCSKHECSTIETRNTLMFGEKVKRIKNNPVINIEKNADQSIIMGGIFDFSNYKINRRDKSFDRSNYRSNKRDKSFDKTNYKINRKDKSFDKKIEKYENLSSINRSIDRSLNKSVDLKENQFLKMQVRQMKERMELDTTHIEHLNEKNHILETQKKNLLDELEKLTSKKKDADESDKINSFYIKNNINDLHNLLNEKEYKEKNLINEINTIKLFYEQKIKDLNDIIIKQQKQITEMKNAQIENIYTCQELTECLNEASNQINIKEQIINK